ncbi:MAG: LamG domain-containing protein [Phycisphaeraceae bacterium]|nr:LamG domain-containing protein [Phycisphaerales bacterium]MCB9859689.1 LamG domain-containing protein [Phycisphaeraceae bacterium]
MKKWAALSLIGMLSSVLHADLISHWKLDEPVGNDAAFDLVGMRHGVVINGVFHPNGGVVDGAIEIRSANNAYVSMHGVLPMTSGESFTLAGWVRLDAGDLSPGIPFGRHLSTVVAGYFIGTNQLGTYGSPGTAYLYHSSLGSSSPNSTTLINDGQWHHIVGVYEASGMSHIYVDGAPVESSFVSQTIQSSTATFMIGGMNFPGLGPQNYFDGFVDDVQVYDEALCSYDIDWLFNHPGEPLPEVVCYADCNNSCSLDIFDYICFGNAYAASTSYADCDGSGSLNIFDYICFGNAYAAGCL